MSLEGSPISAMDGVEERRMRLTAMREEADAQIDNKNVSSTPSTPSLSSAPLLSNPLDDDSSADAVSAELKKSCNFDFYTDPLAGYSGSKRRKPKVGILPEPTQVPPPPLTSIASRYASAGLLPPPPSPHLQPAGVCPPPLGRPSWQPIAYQPPSSNPGFAHEQPPSVWQAVGSQIPYANPAFAHPQPPAQSQSQLPPHHVKQWSNQALGRGRGRRGDRAFGGTYNGRQSPNSPSGDSWRNASASEGRGAPGRGRGGRIASAKEQPHLFAKKSMLEDPWLALEAERMERT